MNISLSTWIRVDINQDATEKKKWQIQQRSIWKQGWRGAEGSSLADSHIIGLDRVSFCHHSRRRVVKLPRLLLLPQQAQTKTKPSPADLLLSFMETRSKKVLVSPRNSRSATAVDQEMAQPWRWVLWQTGSGHIREALGAPPPKSPFQFHDGRSRR